MDAPALRERIREWGGELGFSRVGFARAVEPAGRRRLLRWLDLGYHAGMAWMARDPESRCDPEKILPGCKTVVAVALNYFGGEPVPLVPEAPRFSRYAWGEDYHQVLGEKLRLLEARIRGARPELRSRLACDTSPVMDKAWAAAAGLGWQGKNTCLIHPEIGSWFFLGEIFLDLDLPPDPIVLDHCGSCTRCLEVCPTDALVRPYVLDAARCISYLTIEHRGEFPDALTSEPPAAEPAKTPSAAEAIGDWLVGCDLCQDVCPWNRKAPATEESRFRPRPGLADRSPEEWMGMSDEEYRTAVRGSAVTRIKPPDMRRNAAAVAANRLRSAAVGKADPRRRSG